MSLLKAAAGVVGMYFKQILNQLSGKIRKKELGNQMR